MPRYLVLDRSWLQAASPERVSQLCDSYRVVMSDALFFETFGGDPDIRRTLFAKFPARENPVELVPHIGVLMRHEIEHREPSSPAEKLSIQQRYKFNAKLRTGEFVLNDKQQAVVDEWVQFQIKAQSDFLDRYACIHDWFPELASYKAGQPRGVIDAAWQRVAMDTSFVASIYDEIKEPELPPTFLVGPSWALFRWLQVQLLYGLEYVRRHGAARRDIVSKLIPNDVVDRQYVTTALLADGLASRDAFLKKVYLQLKPHGELLGE